MNHEPFGQLKTKIALAHRIPVYFQRFVRAQRVHCLEGAQDDLELTFNEPNGHAWQDLQVSLSGFLCHLLGQRRCWSDMCSANNRTPAKNASLLFCLQVLHDTHDDSFDQPRRTFSADVYRYEVAHAETYATSDGYASLKAAMAALCTWEMQRCAVLVMRGRAEPVDRLGRLLLAAGRFPKPLLEVIVYLTYHADAGLAFGQQPPAAELMEAQHMLAVTEYGEAAKYKALALARRCGGRRDGEPRVQVGLDREFLTDDWQLGWALGERHVRSFFLLTRTCGEDTLQTVKPAHADCGSHSCMGVH